MTNKNYWENFYKNKHIDKESSFSKFCLQFIPKKAKIIEFGSGNGRDTFFFGKRGFDILGVDYAFCPLNRIKNVSFIKSDLSEFLAKNINHRDVVYARFFLHSISKKDITKLLLWSKKLICLEFRSKEDIPILYTNHKRTVVDENKLLIEMINKNYDLLYYSKSKGVAKFKNEDPIIVRIIAYKREK